MMKMYRIALIVAILTSFVALILWVRQELTIDSCLDNGGRWNSIKATCEGAVDLQSDRVDDAYLGGERTGGGPGRGSSNKVAFVAAVEMREGRPQRVRFDPVAGFSFAALTPWARQAVAPGSCVVSDGLLGFEVLERLGYTHKVVLAPRGKAGTALDKN